MASTVATICGLLLESDVGPGVGDAGVAVGSGGDPEGVPLALGVVLGESVGTTGVVHALPLRLTRMASTSHGTGRAKVLKARTRPPRSGSPWPLCALARPVQARRLPGVHRPTGPRRRSRRTGARPT